jgi:hypothetical protein
LRTKVISEILLIGRRACNLTGDHILFFKLAPRARFCDCFYMLYRHLFCSVISAAMTAAAEPQAKPATMSAILAGSQPADWRKLDPENTLYLDLAAGRVIIELAPEFAR